MLPTKKLASVILLFSTGLLFAASGFELTGMVGIPRPGWAITLGLAAQIAAFAAGTIAPSNTGKTGFVRSIVLLFYVIQTLSLAIDLLALVFGHFHGVDLLEPSQMTWVLVEGFSALGLGLVAAKTWRAGSTPSN